MQVNSASERVKLLLLSGVCPATHEIQQCSSSLGGTFKAVMTSCRHVMERIQLQ